MNKLAFHRGLTKVALPGWLLGAALGSKTGNIFGIPAGASIGYGAADRLLKADPADAPRSKAENLARAALLTGGKGAVGHTVGSALGGIAGAFAGGGGNPPIKRLLTAMGYHLGGATGALLGAKSGWNEYRKTPNKNEVL